MHGRPQSGRASRSGRRLALVISVLIIVGGALLAAQGTSPAPAGGQDGGKKEGDPQGQGGGKRPGAPPEAPAPDPREEAIKALFAAPVAMFTEEGKLRLYYFFGAGNEKVLKDFIPPIETTKKRIRWGGKGDAKRNLIIAEQGIFLHRASWKSVKFEVKYTSRSALAGRDFLAAVFSYKKRKRAVGSNLGRQILRFKGPRIAAKPLPTDFPGTAFGESINFGFQVENGVFRCIRGGDTTIDSSSLPTLLKKVASGQPGLMWNGRVQGFLDQITIEGELDPEWLEKQLSEVE